MHTRAHLDLIKRAAESGGRWVDPDTHVSPRSYEIALLSAGGAITATKLWDEELVPFALIRPPGHHATPDRAMGFCLFNNVAIAVAKLLEDGYERVAIIDWDVHHGNGTQAIFYDEPRVLYVSMHQWPHYPGSGFFTECGEGRAEGLTVNVPLPAAATDGDYAHTFAVIVEPIVTQFAPQAILVSAGQTSTPATRWATCWSAMPASPIWHCAAPAWRSASRAGWPSSSRAGTTAMPRRAPWRQSCAPSSTSGRPPWARAPRGARPPSPEHARCKRHTGRV